MLNLKSQALAAVMVLSLGLLVGCGKTAPTQEGPKLDSVFARMATNTEETTRIVAKEQQEREDQENDAAETAKVGAPGNEKVSFRRD